LHEEWNGDETLEYPCKLSVFWHIRLSKENHLFRIDADSDVILHNIDDVLTEDVRISDCGECVEIGNHEVALVITIHISEWLQCTKVVTDVESP
jgi:hypothetical protein